MLFKYLCHEIYNKISLQYDKNIVLYIYKGGRNAMERTSIGIRIKELRTQAGFNQSVIAEYLQVDQSLISKIEKGEREASTDVLKKLAELFGCKVSTIINEEEEISCLNVAFRTSGMTGEDLKSIAVINRIALNLENMQQILEGRCNEKC